ncbi:universal stress protein [Nitrosopumilus sp. b1]|uniref:universal stress protein n=1 Tax=Nitrosopumilus sp. b1 TaxID=2109907 RepID=UPI0015F4386E|nr:universal stress protein [Nitrosopumilus sp. b1]KAF6243321.1 universal stress protein [Nitrosopumilus sp. b1]
MAKKINKILLPLDGSANSKRAMDQAIDVAQKFDARINLVYVLPFPAVQAYVPNKAAREQMYKEAKRHLASAKKQIDNKGVDSKSDIIKGNPGSAIAAYANKSTNKIDLIVIGSRGLGGLKEKFLGSVSNHVMHSTKVPCLIVK